MTDKEKMLKGQLYQAFAEELSRERQKAKELLWEYNLSPPGTIEKRKEIITRLLGKVSSNFWIEPPFYCDYGYNITIGENFYANYNCTILDCAQVKIGDNVMCGPNVSLFTAGHPLDFQIRNQGWEYAYPIIIGNNVWLGGGVIVNPGITIGDNAVIGSGSVVTKDIPANSLAVGNPCKVIRKLEWKQYTSGDINDRN
ncbi:MAG: sugar O-acetyltransferase [Desulfitobacteriia bacterium]